MAAWMLLVLASLWIPAAAADEDVSCVVMKSCVLPCSFKSGHDPIVQWQKVPSGIIVHRFRDGKDQLKDQDPDYNGRTSLFMDEILRGNASLLLTGLRLTDQGQYKCFTAPADTASKTSFINLRVEGAVGPVSIEQSGDVLLCSSENIHFKPSVSWSRSPPTQSEPTLSVQEHKEQVYSVSSSVPLPPIPPLEYTCNISTEHGWRSATYSWRPPAVDSGNVFVPCTASMTSIKKLKWTFNSNQTILTRTETGVDYTAAPWRPFVVSVLVSGGLTLHKLSPDQHGVYLCEQQTDTETYFTKTEVKAVPTPVVGGIVSFLIIIIIIIIIVGVVYYFKRKREKHEKREKDLYLNQQKQEEQHQQQGGQQQQQQGGQQQQQQGGQQQQKPEEVGLLELSEGGQSPTLFSQLLETLEKLPNKDFKTFKSLLKDKSFLKDFEEIPQNNLETKGRGEIVYVMMVTYGVHSITVTKRVLEKMEKYKQLNNLSGLSAKGLIWSCQSIFKSKLETRIKFLTEGNTESESLFNERYTEMFVTVVNTGQRKTCEDIFKGQTEKGTPIRTVLTKGVAGIGKTVLTQKFSLDWAEGRANQDIQLLFPFTFRELNVLRDRQYNLVGLLQHFSGSKGLSSFQHLQVVFVFDGLDECRLPLDFTQTRDLTDPTESVSLDVLLVNLIRGSLLPSARLWITTRPAAANQIPAECVSMVTEVRGFSDPQKEQYFRKRFRDEEQATAVISHIKKTYVLHTMCHIPFFCRILATVIENMMKYSDRPKLPQTLTELYIHILLVQDKVKNVKYDEHSETDPHWTPETRKMEDLGKLSFEQLQKGNLIFHESDLRQCGLEPTEASVYSGVFTQVFREQTVLENKVYWFTHLSVQEFLAALHVHQSFVNTGVNLLSEQVKDSSPDTIKPKLQHLHQTAVDQALQSSNGHLDLFLRFLLGLSLSTNQSLLQGLLTQTGSEQTNQETVKYIKMKLSEDLSPERSLNLFHCLNELEDHSLMEDIHRYMKEGALSDRDMSPVQWSALALLMRSSGTDLEEFDLRKYNRSETALVHLLPVIKISPKATLSGCNLSPKICSTVSSILGSAIFTILDLSNNNLHNAGVKLLCEGLKTPRCRLETLWLSGCMVSEEGGASLASALSSAQSHLRELDLSYNDPGASAKHLTTLWVGRNLPKDTLRLKPAGKQMMTPGFKKYYRELTLDPNTANRHLQLSEKESDRRVTRTEDEKQYPDHPDRFSYRPQVLCSTPLTGRCYWEVDWSGRDVSIAVSYKGIKRTGDRECRFEFNKQSWCLEIRDGEYTLHYYKKIEIPSVSTDKKGGAGVFSGRVGVFLDYEAGALSFYKVSDGRQSHIYTFSSAFTEPLFAGFGVKEGSVSLVNVRSVPPGELRYE